jgi:16S rRNA (cytidine1402-2'-O)-methyltransferase
MPSKPAIEATAPALPGTLFVVATPIGNLADITLRALEVLRSVHLIAAEDTRHTRKLLSFYDIHKPLISYHSQNVRERGPELVAKLQSGTMVALVTDAGTPGISDPGALLVHQVLAHGLPVAVIPGPTALISALVASGLPTHPFAFLGFPPAKGSGRKRFFSTHASLSMTLILYEAPQRLQKTLEEILLAWGNRRLTVARELTKKFEECFRGTVSEAAEHFAEGTRGEVTLVVEGCPEGGVVVLAPPQDWVEVLASLLEGSHLPVKQATAEIVRRYGLPRRTVYQKALEMRRQDRPEEERE